MSIKITYIALMVGLYLIWFAYCIISYDTLLLYGYVTLLAFPFLAFVGGMYFLKYGFLQKLGLSLILAVFAYFAWTLSYNVGTYIGFQIYGDPENWKQNTDGSMTSKPPKYNE